MTKEDGLIVKNPQYSHRRSIKKVFFSEQLTEYNPSDEVRAALSLEKAIEQDDLASFCWRMIERRLQHGSLTFAEVELEALKSSLSNRPLLNSLFELLTNNIHQSTTTSMPLLASTFVVSSIESGDLYTFCKLLLAYSRNLANFQFYDNEMNRFSALHYAIMHNDYEMTGLLLLVGADWNSLSVVSSSPDPYHTGNGLTPLHTAVRKNNFLLTELLLNFGVPVGEGNFTHTLLQDAIDTRSHKLLKLLLSFGADVDGQNGFGYTALMHAIEVRNYSICLLLLEHNASLEPKNNDDQDAMMLAFAQPKVSLAIIRALWKRSIESKSQQELECYFHQAIRANLRDVVNHLLRSDCLDFDTPDPQTGCLPIFTAIGGLDRHVDPEEHALMVGFFYEDEEDQPDIYYNELNPLQYAIKMTAPSQVIELFCPDKYPLFNDDKEKDTFLKHLLGYRTLPLDALSNHVQWTASFVEEFFLKTIQDDRLGLVRSLVTFYPDLKKTRFENGRTGLMEAVCANAGLVVDFLFSASTDHDAVDDDGETVATLAEKNEKSYLLNVSAMTQGTMHPAFAPLWKKQKHRGEYMTEISSTQSYDSDLNLLGDDAQFKEKIGECSSP